MSTIALKAVMAPGTGTGKSFEAYDLKGPSAIFREVAPVAQPGTMLLKRTEPKATKDYAGAMRGEVKLTRSFADAQGRLWPAVLTATSSLPVFLTDAQRVAFIQEGTLFVGDGACQDALSKLLIPQS